MATTAEWSRGYARQAAADFEMFQALDLMGTVHECHKLQFLQMSCEKLVKAHLCRDGTNLELLQHSHAYVTDTLPVVLRQEAAFLRLRGSVARSILKQAKYLAQEIDMLSPSVKRGGQRPDNCEYPWEYDRKELHVPLDWPFYPSQLLVMSAGRAVLKLIRGAIDRLLVSI